MSADARTWKSRKLIAVVGALLGAVSAGCERRVASASAPPAPTVEVAPVIQKDVPVEGEWVGTPLFVPALCGAGNRTHG
jgi:hypothetical protein